MPKDRRGKHGSRCRSQSAPAVLHSPCKARRKQWTETQMRSAMDAIKKGQLSVLRAAVQYDVPRTTLHDRISGRVVHGTNPGAKPYLNKVEEKEHSHCQKNWLW